MGEETTTNVHVAIAELARRLHAADDRPAEAVLGDVVGGAIDHVPGAEAASISITHGRNALTTEFSTDPLATRHNEIQTAHGEGPCLAAAWDEAVVRIDDLWEDDRWPGYAVDARSAVPFRSILSFRLYTADEKLGTLTLYSRTPGNFGTDVEEIGLVYAAHVANAWMARERKSQFTSALASRDIIGQAKGMIMERFGIDAVQAFELLRRLSQDGNIKLAELARQLVETDHPAREESSRS
ncbi:GAF and ANTAR domain-containing protein [Williamsia herbipolensis]|uniref:GAF and ANTAR domain-containing protein n=1 Tax=Williamsia herbipolensis TaxID=1603258 RepID=UPI0005F78588|nr:GAF and ANTAR domain-containing protein [Williamsia herbipolensis]